jgi:peptide/nickel transport system permease protein
VGHYLLRRLATSAIVIAGLSVVFFLLLHAIYPAPGRDVLGPQRPWAMVRAWNRQHGFYAPVGVQYWRYVSGLIHGNFGYSYKLNQPIATLFAHRWARSVYLTLVSWLLAVLIAVSLGIFQAVRRNSRIDQIATGLQFFLYAMPQFLFLLIAIQVFVFTVPIFGYEASQSTSLLTVMTDWHDMALPVACLAVLIAAPLCRYMRSAAIETLAQDYILVVRAKGLPERLVLSRHLLRNSCLPLITLLGLSMPALLAGDFLVEIVFNYHGLGALAYEGMFSGDYPLILAYTLVGAILTLLGNLLADIALTLADPRLRLTSSRQ